MAGDRSKALEELPSVSYGPVWKQVSTQDAAGGGWASWEEQMGQVRENWAGEGGAAAAPQ